jgi:hypothetical protein
MKKEIDIFDKPVNIKIMMVLFHIALVALIILDLVYPNEHSYFPWDGMPSFFAAFGFVACVLVITISKILRFFLKQDEDYYDK